MSLPVPSVRKEECVEWNFYCPIDATAHRSYSEESSEHGTNNLFSSLRKSFPVSPRPPLLPKNPRPRSSHPSVDPFLKRLAPVTNPYRYKRANKAPYPPPCP